MKESGSQDASRGGSQELEAKGPTKRTRGTSKIKKRLGSHGNLGGENQLPESEGTLRRESGPQGAIGVLRRGTRYQEASRGRNYNLKTWVFKEGIRTSKTMAP